MRNALIDFPCSPRRRFAGLATLALLAAGPATARTWNIFEDESGDARTIQEAMDQAEFGDTVLVWPGWYVGPIKMTSGVTLISQAGADSTTLDAGFAPHVIDAGRESSVTQVTVEGFTLTGTGNSFQTPAHTIHVDGDATVRDCVVKGVRALVAGAHLTRGDLRIYDTVFRDNLGGFLDDFVSGINCVDGYLVVQRCTFERCTNGYVLRVLGGIVEFRDNVVRDSGTIEIEPTPMSVLIFNNLFDGIPFPITVNGGPSVIIRQNTFARAGPNVAALGPAVGTNTIIDRNVTTGATQGLWICSTCSGPVTCNDSWGNRDNWIGRGDLAGIDDNFSAAPEYCDPRGGDFHVSGDSPLLPRNSPCGAQVGAYLAGCAATPIEAVSWGSVKARYR